MKYWILILAPALLLITAPESRAHNVVSVTGTNQGHQHVYRRQQYGKPLQQGHLVQTQNSKGTVIWGSGTRSDYGKSIVRRRGPIIDEHAHKSSTEQNKIKRKFGSEVHGYGKPDQNK